MQKMEAPDLFPEFAPEPLTWEQEREVVAHFFDSSEEAYDASQTDDEIFDGDLLIIPSEGIIGLLMRAWPTALTIEYGCFGVATLPWSQMEEGRYLQVAGAGQRIISEWDIEGPSEGETSIDAINGLLAPVSLDEIKESFQASVTALMHDDQETYDRTTRHFAACAGITLATAQERVRDHVSITLGQQGEPLEGLDFDSVIETEQPVVMIKWAFLVAAFILGLIVGTGVGRIMLAGIFAGGRLIFGAEMTLLRLLGL